MNGNCTRIDLNGNYIFYNNNFTVHWKVLLQDMINSCLVVKRYRKENLLNLSRNFNPKMFHIICIPNSLKKLEFLNSSGLLFYNSNEKSVFHQKL